MVKKNLERPTCQRHSTFMYKLHKNCLPYYYGKLSEQNRLFPDHEKYAFLNACTHIYYLKLYWGTFKITVSALGDVHLDKTDCLLYLNSYGVLGQKVRPACHALV